VKNTMLGVIFVGLSRTQLSIWKKKKKLIETACRSPNVKISQFIIRVIHVNDIITHLNVIIYQCLPVD